MKNTINTIFIALLFICQQTLAQGIGDPGVTFDASKFDSDYPQMQQWKTAGVTGGIPYTGQTPVKKTINATNSAGLNAAINDVYNMGGGALKLNNGTYTINATVNMKSGVRIIGQSQNGVKLNITMTGNSGNAINFSNVDKAGIDILTVQGGYGTPNNFSMTDAKPNFLITSVNFHYATNCWLSKVKIINSGNHAFSIWRGGHITIRDCYIERSWNKSGGGHGYVQFQTSYCLMYNTVIKKMRHIAIQSQHAQYNVFYKNNVEQDFNFHNGDSGNNLVEQNTSTIPSGLQNAWHAVMGPWSTQHSISAKDNFVYKNNCRENNNGGQATFSNNSKVYLGARAREQQGGVFVTTNNTPTGGTFYPVIISGSSGGSSSGPPIGKQIAFRKSGGDKKWVTANIGQGDELIAQAGTVQSWEKFNVVNHTSGGGLIALKANSNGKYIQSNSGNINVVIKAKGNYTGNWERFQWKDKGTGKMALKSIQTNKWVQASHSANNAKLYPKGNADLSWETFDYTVLGNATRTRNDQGIEEEKFEFTAKFDVNAYPNPIKNNDLNIDVVLPQKGDIIASILSLDGRQLFRETYTNFVSGGYTITIPVNKLNLSSSGIYLLKVSSGTNERITRIILQ